MNTKLLSTFLLFSLFVSGSVLFLTNCKGGGKGDDKDTTKTDSVVQTNMPKPGEIPFDFPTVKTSSKTGEYCLAPSKAFLDDAWANGGENATFIFYSRKCVAPGDVESEVEEIGQTVKMPNSLIIPIPSGQKAAVGDIVLTWWQSGSGMQRAIVTDASNPAEPKVKYLDLDYDNPATNSDGVPIGQMEEQLKPNSFTKISAEWEPGTAIAYNDGNYYYHKNVVKVDGNKVLTLGWAGRVEVLDKSKCIPIPVKLAVKAGDNVQVPYIGSYTKGVVKKVDAKSGRVFTEIEFGGQKEEVAVAIGDVANNIPLK